MNKKILSLIILFLGVFSVIQAQNDGKIRVKGVVLDETTRQPIAFANIGIIGTAAGAASDMDGLFELIVSEKLATYMMRVSAVGYASAEMKVYEARDKGEVQILLKPVTYGIGEVDVTAESLVLKKLLENVVKNIGRNYIPRPYNYEGYFEYGVEVNDGEISGQKTNNLSCIRYLILRYNSPYRITFQKQRLTPKIAFIFLPKKINTRGISNAK